MDASLTARDVRSVKLVSTDAGETRLGMFSVGVTLCRSYHRGLRVMIHIWPPDPEFLKNVRE